MTFLIIPKSVRKIDRVAFGECKKLKFVFFNGQIPENFKTDIFTGISRESKIIVNEIIGCPKKCLIFF